MALKIEVTGKAVAYTDKELKKAAQLEVELPSLVHHKIELPGNIQTELLADLESVLDTYKERIMKAQGPIDGKNGDGYLESLLSMHKVQCSLFSAKNQNKAHKILAVSTGVIPAEVLESEASSAGVPTEVETVEVDI